MDTQTQFIRLALVGAPGSGKTLGLPLLRRHARASGLAARTIPEAASIILRMLKPADPRDLGPVGVFELQRAVFRLQTSLEAAALVAPARPGQACVVLSDRGALDGEVYLGRDRWHELLAQESTDPESLLPRYDAVIHLGCAAGLEALEAYKAVGVRAEDRELALRLEERAIEVWSRHPNYRYVPASIDIEAKWSRMYSDFDALMHTVRRG